jgi:hypothetical protein
LSTEVPSHVSVSANMSALFDSIRSQIDVDFDVVVKSHHFRLCVIYRPPPSRTNKLKNTTFFEEWSEFLDHLVVIPDELLITGDLNFHLDNVNLSDTRKFGSLTDGVVCMIVLLSLVITTSSV